LCFTALMVGNLRQVCSSFSMTMPIVRITGRMTGLKKPKVFLQVGAMPLFTATRNSFLNDFIEFAGGTNIAGGAKSGFYSREEVVNENPDIIFIVAMGMVIENEEQTWRRFPTINAVKHNRIFSADPYKVCSPTPETFVEVLEHIAAAVHPESGGEK
ncbi:MAG: ABC transporter substrate-binding protein, partial [Nitrospirae bacterium]|nr:ABC transporter substrate-binding protein [Nitrospirota bacterium]